MHQMRKFGNNTTDLRGCLMRGVGGHFCFFDSPNRCMEDRSWIYFKGQCYE